MQIKGFGHSVVGGREMNQDAFLADDQKQLYAVADGVGGGLRGEVASKMSVDGLQAAYQPGAELKPIVENLAAAVLKEALESCGGEALMGTTLTCFQITGDYAHLCHVGDSRAYLYDGVHLKQLTSDHESYDENLGGAVLCSYLGLDTRVYNLTVQTELIELKPGYRLLLCSDGLYKQLDDMQIVNYIRDQKDQPEELLKTLCRQAAKAEYSDNVTVVYIEIEA